MSHCPLFVKSEHPFLYHIFYEGYAGVSFFFILSGFILAYNYQQRFIGKLIEKKTFYVSRLARLYPLHIFSMLLWIWMGKDLPVDSTYLVNLVRNITLLQSVYPLEGIKFNAVSWSLSTEMFFYLSFPFIVGWLVKSKRSLIACFIILIGTVSITTCMSEDNDFSEWLLYASPYFRVVDFIIGILLYNLCKSGKLDQWRKRISPTLLELSALILLLFFYCIAFYVPQVYRHALWYWIPIGILIFSFYYQAGNISRFFSTSGWVLLGEISFSFYMLHTFVKAYVKRAGVIFNIDIPIYLVFILVLVITLLFSYLSFRYIEGSANKFVKRLFLKRK
ncbi:acyltransferase family protein [Viscerimonas tarda]